MVAMLVFQMSYEVLRTICGHAALLSRNLQNRRVYILCHSRGVAANVDTGTVFDPLPEDARALHHAILDVYLASLIAGERSVQTREVAIDEHCLKFFAIQEVRRRASLAEKKPVAALVPKRSTLVQKATEGCDASAWTDHDHGRV